MKISLIGMSGSGKSYWATKLEKSGFRRYSIDDLLEAKLETGLRQLGYRGLTDLAKWMRQPYEDRYVRTSATYLEYEKKALLEVLMEIEEQKDTENIVVDTTGSVVYTGEKILNKLSEITNVVYLDTPKSVQDAMYQLYIQDPKPVFWGKSFSIKKGESGRDALARCYPELLAYRTNEYKKLAQLTFSYEQLREKAFSVESFISSLKMITYTSTRGDKKHYTFPEVILKGIAEDGGLFVPNVLPKVSHEELKSLTNATYHEIALHIFEKFQTGISPKDLQTMIAKAYRNTFDTKKVAPVVPLKKNYHVLELWHGPTSAFKDMALQIMPLFFEYALQKEAKPKNYIILAATSGDTGVAALEGFKDKKNISVIVFYPDRSVSLLQELQMVTHEGGNVFVYSMEGSFDDAQRSVKDVFNDGAFNAELLNKHNTVLSSANSINWGRLMPQIVYHFTAYLQLVQNGTIHMGDEVDIAVPSGNFGNLLAALYAKHMGLPVRKFICASNANNVLTTFLQTGVYDVSNRTMVKTPSPSMDILVANNIERLLLFLTKDQLKIRAWMNDLKIKKKFSVDPKTKKQLNELFFADWVSNEDCLVTIKNVFDETGYLMDTHTAVCEQVVERYSAKTGSDIPLIICSTAHFAKFPLAVYQALTGSKDTSNENEFDLLSAIKKLAPTVSIPENLIALKKKKILHKKKSASGKAPVIEIIRQICQ